MSQATYSREDSKAEVDTEARTVEGQVNAILRYEAAQAVRLPVKSSDDDENFVFDKQPNRVDTVKFVAAQRNLVDYVSTRYPDVGKIC